MSCKASVQFLQVPDWARPVLAAWGSGMAKIIDPSPGDDPFPGLAKVLRVNSDDWDRSLLAQGRAGGGEYMRRMKDNWARFRGWGRVVCELPNEPGCNGNEELWSLDAFTVRCLEVAGDWRRDGWADFALCVWNLPTGNPAKNEGETEEQARRTERWKMQQLAPSARLAIAGGHYLGLHCYWARPVETPEGEWNAQRWRRNLDHLAAAGVEARKARVLITETGVEGGLLGRGGQGWHTCSSAERYRDDIALYERKAREDPRVEAFFLFIAGHPGWQGFDIDKKMAEMVAPALRALGDLPVVAPPQPRRAKLVMDGRCMSPEQFAEYLAGLQIVDPWSRVVAHHTWVPTIPKWHGARTMEAMRRVYEGRGWERAPHAFAGPEGIWIMFDLARDGYGVTGGNRGVRHVEFVGDYSSAAPSGPVLENGLAACAALLGRIGADSRSLYHHGQVEKVACPGAAFVRRWEAMRRAVDDRLLGAVTDGSEIPDDALALVAEGRARVGRALADRVAGRARRADALLATLVEPERGLLRRAERLLGKE